MFRAGANGETFVSATMCPQQCVLVCHGPKGEIMQYCNSHNNDEGIRKGGAQYEEQTRNIGSLW